MEWIEITSWIAGSLLLAALHVWMRKQRLANPFGLYAAAVLGALAAAELWIRMTAAASRSIEGGA